MIGLSQIVGGDLMVFGRSRAFTAVLLGALLLPSGAMAQTRKRADIDVQEVKRPKRGSQKAQPQQLNRSAVFAIQVEQKIIKGIDTTVKYLERQANKMDRKSAGRLNLLEKVINLNLEQAVYLRNEEERSYDDKWTEWDVNGRRGPEPRLNTNQSKTQWQKVIKNSKEILAEYPRSENADKVIFAQAMAMQYLGNEKEAARIYTQLIQKYPNSPIAGDAYASLGDYFFDNNDFSNATNNYTKAAKYTRSSRYLWSVFKLGWCSYNLGRYNEALNYWKSLVKIARAKPNEKGATQLRDEALRDMVFAFAELRQVDPAIAYFRANGGQKHIGPLLTLLSQTFADQGQYAAAIATLKRFQKIEPYGPDTPGTQKEIISLNYELGRMKETWAELRQFAPMFGPSSQWAARNAADKKLVAETQQMIKDQMLYFAKITHKRAIDGESEPLHVEAKNGYLLFLQSYSQSKEVAEVKFNLGDIEYFLKNYRQAGTYYLDIVSLGPDKALIFETKTNKPENIHKQSALYMIESYAKDFQPEFKALVKQKPDFKKPPQKLSAKAANYVKSCALFKKYYPKDEKIIKTCDLDITKIFYHTNSKDKARDLLLAVAIKYPKEKEGPASVEQLIPLYADDEQKLLAIADRLLKIPEYQKGELGKKLEGLRRGAELKNIEKEKDSLKRAQMYEAQAKKDPKGAEVEKLWFNAAVNYLAAGEVAAAINAYLVLIKRFPNFGETEGAYLEVARLYEKRFDFETSAGYYAQFASRYPKSKDTPGAASKTCELLLAIESAKAGSVCADFSQKYPDGARGFVERLIVNAERSKQFERMAQLIRTQYLNRYRLSPNEQIVALYKIYRAAGGRGAGAQQAGGEILGVYQKNAGAVSGEALRYVGELVFRQVDGNISNYQKVKLVGGTVDRLVASIDQKATALAQLKAGYDRVIATKDSYWGVAALFRLGTAYEEFANMLADPPGIQGAEKKDVLAKLEPQIKELRKETLNWYRFSYDSAAKFRVYSEFAQPALNGVLRLEGKGMSFEEVIPEPDFVGSEVAAIVAREVGE